MEEYEKRVKMFFEDEISEKSVPPLILPERKKENRFRWDNIFLAACALGSLILFAQPSIYANRIRQTYIPQNKYEAFKETIPRIIFKGFEDMKRIKGVEND